MPSRRPSARDRARRELGQNFLISTSAIDRVLALLEHRRGPVVELGAGRGAITGALVATGRPVTAVELDPHWAEVLRRTVPRARVVRCDLRRFRVPDGTRSVIGNLPFGRTTAALRHLLTEPAWAEAVLLVQWEVARKRGAPGTMLGAQWAPWFEFSAHGRVPARAFRPMPAVDGGLLRIRRRPAPLVAGHDRAAYQRFVEEVFTGRGRDVGEIVRRRTGRRPAVPPGALPRDLDPVTWARLFAGS
ncbi:23S ribosomal RNA methyltransferase Erm [Saccharopolyspora sp. CA-218241]|uniref:23S ribosomal RNA methyltransferase Erm n=1 Tax=Saccharopolyspora sp. CA-218241 TaxID=3240027 RepID=UPI003D973118